MALPDGNYFCYITSQALKKTSAGKQFIAFGFEVTAKVMPDGSRKNRNEGVAVHTGELIFWLSDKAFDNSLRDVTKIFGAEITSFSTIDPRHPHALSALGKELELACKQEDYRGRMQTKWSMPREMGKPLTETEVDALDQRLAIKRNAGNTDPLELPMDGPPLDAMPTDDDVPF